MDFISDKVKRGNWTKKAIDLYSVGCQLRLILFKIFKGENSTKRVDELQAQFCAYVITG